MNIWDKIHRECFEYHVWGVDDNGNHHVCSQCYEVLTKYEDDGEEQ